MAFSTSDGPACGSTDVECIIFPEVAKRSTFFCLCEAIDLRWTKHIRIDATSVTATSDNGIATATAEMLAWLFVDSCPGARFCIEIVVVMIPDVPVEPDATEVINPA